MALRYAVASGNWSSTATWNGGTLPTSADDVYSNNFTVTIDQNINILSLRNSADAPAVAGGSFVVTSTGRTITMTGVGTVTGVASVGVIQLNAPSITLTIAGAVTGGPTANFWGSQISVGSTGSTLNIIGSVNTTGTTASGYGVNNLAGSTIIYLTGDVNTSGAVGIRCSVANAFVVVTGNSMGGLTSTASGVSVVGSSSIQVIGNCTAAGGPAISTNSSTSSLSCSGTTTAANWYAIDGMGVVTVSSPVISSNTYNAINAQITKLFAASPITFTFKDEFNVNKVLYSAGVDLGNPTAANVRSGTTYGASLELTGTLAVPSPTTVLSGVPTDNTVGSFSTTPALIATEIFTKLLASTDFDTASSFGKLVKDFLDAAVSSRLSSAGYTAPNNSDITAIKAKTDNLPSDPASNTQVATRSSQTSVDSIKSNTDLIPAAI